jgi:hypothetical protein
VVACTSDFFAKNVIGRFPQESLVSIWNNQKMLAFRKSMINQTYLKFNPDCQNCDSLWEKRILSLPAGIRGVLAASACTMIGQQYFNKLKKVASHINRDFPMHVID